MDPFGSSFSGFQPHSKLGQERLGLPRSTRSSAPPSARTMELVSNDGIMEEDSVPNGHIYRP